MTQGSLLPHTSYPTFNKGLPVGKIFPESENEKADVLRATDTSERHRKQKITWEIHRANFLVEKMFVPSASTPVSQAECV